MNALWGWSLTTALAWVVLAIWRMFTYAPTDFAVVASIGIFNLIVVWCIQSDAASLAAFRKVTASSIFAFDPQDP